MHISGYGQFSNDQSETWAKTLGALHADPGNFELSNVDDDTYYTHSYYSFSYNNNNDCYYYYYCYCYSV